MAALPEITLSNFFNRLVQQSIEMGNNYMLPIINIAREKIITGNPKPKRIALTYEHPPTDRNDLSPALQTLKDNIVQKAMDIVNNDAEWTSHVNNPTKRIDTILNHVKFLPSVNSSSLKYFPTASSAPTITINSSLNDHLKDNYTILPDGSNLYEIPLFFIVRKPVVHTTLVKSKNPIKWYTEIKDYATETSHLSVIVAFRNKLYSFGFGQNQDAPPSPGNPQIKRAELRENIPATYHFKNRFIASIVKNPFTVFKGVFYTPDANPFLKTRSGHPYPYEIIDVGVFTKTHANTILQKLQFQAPNKFHATGSPVESWYLDIEYSADKYDTAYIYPKISILVPGLEYKLCSRITNTTYNCTTFIEEIFPERINCIGLSTAYSKPTRCKRKTNTLSANNLKVLLPEENLLPDIKEKHIRDIFGPDINAGTVRLASYAAPVVSAPMAAAAAAPVVSGPMAAAPEASKTAKASSRRKSVARGVGQTSEIGSGTRRQSVSKSKKNTRRSRA